MTENTGPTNAETAEVEGKPEAPEIDWKAKAREWEKRAKENKDAAERLTALEEAQKSEQEKLAERLAEAERRAKQAETAALVARVAAEKGVPASALAGEDEETLRAKADELIAWRESAAASKPPAAPRRPLKSGAAPDDGSAGKGRAAAALRAMRGAQ